MRDARLKILSSNGVDRIDRILRITNIQENDGGLYRCLHNDLTLKEVSLNVLGEIEEERHMTFSFCALFVCCLSVCHCRC